MKKFKTIINIIILNIITNIWMYIKLIIFFNKKFKKFTLFKISCSKNIII